MGAAAPAAALALGATSLDALASAVRALAGDSPAALVGAAIAPLLAVASIAERGGGLAAPCLALAAIGWTAAELARASTSRRRPLVALALALAAASIAPLGG